MILQGMYGLGDNLYQRAVIREMGAVDLITPWPQLYVDLPVRCIRPRTDLRTQAKNAARPDLAPMWSPSPAGERVKRIGYGADGSILASFCRSAGIAPAHLDMGGPPTPPVGIEPYVVVRPATVRREWRADARNPDPKYLAEAAAAVREAGYTVISVADLSPGAEWALDPLPPADIVYHSGELTVEYLLALVAGAAGVIGGVGWLLPAALAYRVPMLLVYGGWGKSNGPQRIFDPRVDRSMITEAKPDNFCMCDDRAHSCNKNIGGFHVALGKFVTRLRG